jgi:hypothetical protein
MTMTLGDYLRFAVFAYGSNNEATKYLSRKIAESPNGADEQVLADEVQMLTLLTHLSGLPDE